MIKLIVSRCFVEVEWKHETFEDAAVDAIGQLEEDQSYPVRIVDGDKVLWEQDGHDGPAVEYLREIAVKAGYPE